MEYILVGCNGHGQSLEANGWLSMVQVLDDKFILKEFSYSLDSLPSVPVGTTRAGNCQISLKGGGLSEHLQRAGTPPTVFSSILTESILS